MSGRLGELLVRENLISVQQLRKAQEEQQRSGARIGSALIKTGAIEESKLTDFLSKQYGVPAINLKDFDIDPEIIKLVPKDVAEKHLVIPVNRAGPSLIVATLPEFVTPRMVMSLTLGGVPVPDSSITFLRPTPVILDKTLPCALVWEPIKIPSCAVPP